MNTEEKEIDAYNNGFSAGVCVTAIVFLLPIITLLALGFKVTPTIWHTTQRLRRVLREY